MAENKVVIKINYDKDKQHRAITEPEMVTIWHVRRIVAAILILAILVLIPIFWYFASDAKDDEKVEQPVYAEKQQILKGNEAVTKESDSTIINGSISTAPVMASGGENVGQNESIKESAARPPAIIYSKRVIRASLNKGAHDKEPYEGVKPPIRLSRNEALDIFYFNELRGINEKVLYHLWSKDGQVMEKKPLNINGRRARLVSSRTLAYKDKGEWQIQLVDRKGKVYSEVNFLVELE